MIKTNKSHIKGDGFLKKSSMSVMEMGRLLGLKKTESYWLVHKNYFETKVVAGKMRVMLNSFEHWYTSQNHYKKVSETKGE